MPPSRIGPHVRARCSFLGGPRYLRLPPESQALWWQLMKIALEERREFLPPEYDIEAIALAWHQSVETTTRALNAILGSTRPIISQLHAGDCGKCSPSVHPEAEQPDADPFGRQTYCTCHPILRVRGARQWAPVSWVDEIAVAKAWNRQNPTDEIDLADFVEIKKLADGTVVRSRAKRGGKVPAKRVANAPAVACKGEERRGKDLRSAPASLADILPPPPEGGRPDAATAQTAAPTPHPPAQADKPPLTPAELTRHGIFGPSRKAEEILRRETSTWPPPNGHERRAIVALAAAPDRVIAYCLEISEKFVVGSANVQPWEILDRKCVSLPKVGAEHVTRARAMLKGEA